MHSQLDLSENVHTLQILQYLTAFIRVHTSITFRIHNDDRDLFSYWRRTLGGFSFLLPSCISVLMRHNRWFRLVHFEVSLIHLTLDLG